MCIKNKGFVYIISTIWWVICTIWIWRYLSHFARNNTAWKVEKIHETMPSFHDLLMYIIFIEYEALFTDHINKSPTQYLLCGTDHKFWTFIFNSHLLPGSHYCPVFQARKLLTGTRGDPAVKTIGWKVVSRAWS